MSQLKIIIIIIKLVTQNLDLYLYFAFNCFSSRSLINGSLLLVSIKNYLFSILRYKPTPKKEHSSFIDV